MFKYYAEGKMKVSQKDIWVKHKAVSFVILLISFIAISFSTYIIIHSQNDIRSINRIHEQDIRSLVRIIENNATKKYSNRIKSFLRWHPGKVLDHAVSELANELNTDVDSIIVVSFNRI